MVGSRRWQILALIAMAVIGVVLESGYSELDLSLSVVSG